MVSKLGISLRKQLVLQKKELKTIATKRVPVPSSGEPFERESQKREVLVRTNLLDGLQLLR